MNKINYKTKNIIFTVLVLLITFVSLSSANLSKPIKKVNQNNKYILTVEEQRYLKEHPSIKVHSTADTRPYMFIENGIVQGYSIDYIRLLASKVNLKINIIQGYTWNEYIELLKEEKIDVMLNIIDTKDRENFFLFTKPYFTIVNSVFTRENSTYNSLSDFNGKTLSVVKGFSDIPLLKKFYPKINLLMVDTEKDTFKMLAFGKADGTITNIGVGNSIIAKYGLTTIVPSFEIQDKRFKISISIATNKRNKHLLHILDKAQSLVTNEEKKALDNKWLVETKLYEKYKINYKLLKYALIIIFTIIVLGLYRYIVIQKMNTKLIKQSKELNDARKELELLASTDPLTSLYNRRYFIEISENILHLTARKRVDSFVIIIDIDDFKNVNDTYGHKVGDDVIVKCADIFKKLTRHSDIICRWGGEEFTILFPETDLDGALKISEKIRTSIEESTILLEDKKEVKFTVSIGISKIKSEDMGDINISITRSDKALYKAKNSGKNKICKYLDE